MQHNLCWRVLTSAPSHMHSTLAFWRPSPPPCSTASHRTPDRPPRPQRPRPPTTPARAPRVASQRTPSHDHTTADSASGNAQNIAMNQLCVPVPTASDTQQILKDVFALCRIPWIYDFIFRADPAADISMLLAPVQKRHALSARIFVHATETSSRYAHTFDFCKELMFYSIPAFSVGSITAGFCVEQPAVRKKTDKAKDGLQCIRFIRDDTNGVFLHVSENERTGITEVDCLTHKSSTRRTRVRMKFDLRSLRSVLRTAKGILHPGDISSSLIYLNVSDEKRACPVCCDATAGDCGCELPLQRPTHPLDFRFEASNMGLYTGFYQGATVVRLCSAGHGVINATLQSGSVIQGELNSDLIARLHKMAVVDRISKVKEKPVALVMPDSRLDVSCMMEADAAAEAVAELSKHAASGGGMDVDEIGGGGDDGGGGRDEVAEVERIAEAAGAELEIKESLEADSLFNGDGDVTGGEFADADGLMDANELMGEMDNVCSTEAQGESAVTIGSEGDGSACASLASRCSKRGEEEGSNEGTEMEYEAGQMKENDGRGKTQETSFERRRGSRRREKGDGKAHVAVSEAEKAEIRKKRNREAAARSNLKRKLRNESVRRDLASLTQRAIRLRVKEMMLRDENTRLRNALRNAKASFVPNG